MDCISCIGFIIIFQNLIDKIASRTNVFRLSDTILKLLPKFCHFNTEFYFSEEGATVPRAAKLRSSINFVRLESGFILEVQEFSNARASSTAVDVDSN